MAALTPPLEALRAAVRRGLLAPGARLLVACSGGMDSMALVEALRVSGWAPLVATVDHGLHPESAAHADFVAAWWGARGLPVERLAAEPARVRAGAGPEDGARRERYRLLEACAARLGADRVLTAHTADDQAETLLMRLAQGGGTRGLAGIPAARGPFTRPWLEVRRADVEVFARARDLMWCDDPTNAQARFLRNRVRRVVAPAMAEVFGDSWTSTAARGARHLRGDAEAIAFLLARWRAEASSPVPGGVELRVAALEGAPTGLRWRVLRDLVEEAADRAGVEPVRDLSGHVERLDELVAAGGSGRSLDLPGGLEAHLAYGRLRLARRGPAPAPPVPVRVDAPGEWRYGDWRLIVEPVAELPPPAERGDACLSAVAAPLPWVVRPAQIGDRLRPLGAPGARRVSRLLADARVERRHRPQLPAVESAGRLVWVGGLRIADEARMRPGEAGWRVHLRTGRSVGSIMEDAPSS